MPVYDEDEATRLARINKEAHELYILNDIAHAALLLKSNPPRIVKTAGNGTKQLLIQKPDGSPLVTIDATSLAYQWLFNRVYTMAVPYVLVDLDALAAQEN